jgi:NAD(P)-dependent dehydrogenase (short-subunit alcohol dehydrogenase family)
MATKTISIELKRHGCVCVSIHPGTTDTDLSKPFQKNVKPEKLFNRTFAVASMLNVVWDLGVNDTGKFYAYDGEEIPW